MSRPGVFLVDGSNAVHAIFGSWPGTREDQNRYAADFLARISDWSARRNAEVEVVFDGGFRPLGILPESGDVRVLFSEHDSADALILERARALRFYGKKVTVVTWDRVLAEAARQEEAKISDPKKFWDSVR